MNLFRAILLATVVAAAPGHSGEGRDDVEEGMSLMERGARMLLQGLAAELEPVLRDMESGLREFQDLVGDLSAYHPPEVLPNGDIILRRKQPLTPEPELGEDGEIDL